MALEARLKLDNVEYALDGGKDLIKHEGIEYGVEPVWSKDTGRSTDATMQGKIIATKRTWTISFVPLTYNQLHKITEKISKTEWMSMVLYDGLVTVTATVYASPMKYSAYGGTFGKYTNFQIELIER